MNSQTNPNFFTQKDTESEISLENIFKTLDKSVAYKNTYDRFYSSANQIIDAVNQNNFNKLVSEYNSLNIFGDEVILKPNINDINDLIKRSTEVYEGLKSFIGEEDNINKGFEDYAEHLSNLTKFTYKFETLLEDLIEENGGEDQKEAIKDMDPLIESNQFGRDPLSSNSSFQLYNNYGSNYETFIFHDALEKSFMSGRSYYPSKATDFQRKMIDNTSEVGNLINQLNILDKSVPTFTSKARKKGIMFRLRKKYQEVISPESRNAIEYLFYKYEVEGL